MESQFSFTDDDVEKLACKLELNLIGMIRNLAPARASSIRRASPSSSLGRLDTLPAELLLLALDGLDFQSLSRLSRTCLRGKAVVESLPAYTEMMQHAPDALTALGKTRLLRHHPAGLIRRALRSDKCASCLDFGAFLFLPTCERVCFGCLQRSYGLRVIPLSDAMACFRLTEEQLERVPILHSIPGTYSSQYASFRPDVHRLVCVREAKRLAIDVHGSAENVARFTPEAGPGEPRTKQIRLLRHYHEAPLEPLGCDSSALPEKASWVEDAYGGMASIRFPWLTDGGADRGRMCRGCEVTFWHYHQGVLPASVYSRLVSPASGPHRSLGAMAHRLRPSREFLEHVRECYGARELILGQRRYLSQYSVILSQKLDGAER